jgi:hypothetical protein
LKKYSKNKRLTAAGMIAGTFFRAVIRHCRSWVPVLVNMACRGHRTPGIINLSLRPGNYFPSENAGREIVGFRMETN